MLESIYRVLQYKCTVIVLKSSKVNDTYSNIKCIKIQQKPAQKNTRFSVQADFVLIYRELSAKSDFA